MQTLFLYIDVDIICQADSSKRSFLCLPLHAHTHALPPPPARPPPPPPHLHAPTPPQAGHHLLCQLFLPCLPPTTSPPSTGNMPSRFQTSSDARQADARTASKLPGRRRDSRSEQHRRRALPAHACSNLYLHTIPLHAPSRASLLTPSSLVLGCMVRLDRRPSRAAMRQRTGLPCTCTVWTLPQRAFPARDGRIKLLVRFCLRGIARVYCRPVIGSRGGYACCGSVDKFPDHCNRPTWSRGHLPTFLQRYLPSNRRRSPPASFFFKLGNAVHRDYLQYYTAT